MNISSIFSSQASKMANGRGPELGDNNYPLRNPNSSKHPWTNQKENPLKNMTNQPRSPFIYIKPSSFILPSGKPRTRLYAIPSQNKKNMLALMYSMDTWCTLCSGICRHDNHFGDIISWISKMDHKWWLLLKLAQFESFALQDCRSFG